LRRNLESWLRQLPEARSILALRQAAPKHGGEGAFYVLLKRKNKYAGTDGETTSPKNRPF
jgi:DNA-nicking Smr family endonuclease